MRHKCVKCRKALSERTFLTLCMSCMEDAMMSGSLSFDEPETYPCSSMRTTTTIYDIIDNNGIPETYKDKQVTYKQSSNVKDLEYYVKKLYNIALLLHVDIKNELTKPIEKRKLNELAKRYKDKVRENLVKVKEL